MTTRTALCAVLGVVALVVSSAPAGQSIRGAGHISGRFAPSGGYGLADATGITFVDPNGAFWFGSGQRSENPCHEVGEAALEHFTFAPFETPVDPLVTVTPGSLRFTLSAITLERQDHHHLEFSGTGMLSAPGFDDTPGAIIFRKTAATTETGIYHFSASVHSAGSPGPQPSPWNLRIRSIDLESGTIEIQNTGPNSESLTGFRLATADGTRANVYSPAYSFDGHTLAPGKSVLVRAWDLDHPPPGEGVDALVHPGTLAGRLADRVLAHDFILLP